MTGRHAIPMVFRSTRSNSLSLPLLFSVAERSEWNRHILLKASPFRPILNTAWKRKTIIAYSFMTSDLPSVWKEVRLLRNRFGERVFLVAGGPHPTGDPPGTLKMGFDAVAAGPAEILMPLFLEGFFEGNCRPGHILRSDRPCLELGMPISKTTSLRPPLEITRGCHYHCRFCQTAGTGAEHRSLSSITLYLDEMASRQYLYRTGFICPSAFEFGSEKPGQSSYEHIRALFDLVREKGFRHFEYGIFPSEIRPNTVEPLFLKLIQSACSNKKLTVGAQSGSDRLLRKLRRGHSVADIERAAALIREHGFRPQLDFIFGIPGETEEDLADTLVFVKKLALRYGAWIQSHYFLPLSGTPLEKKNSSPLSEKVMATLRQYHRDGFCTLWWETGMKISRRIMEVREQIQG